MKTLSKQSSSHAKSLVALLLLGAGCESVLGIQDWTPKPTTQTCTLNTDCPNDLVCVFAHCSVACRSDRDCVDSGGRCLTLADGTSGCITPSAAACPKVTCSNGTECSNGECRTPCSVGCRADQTCESDVCIGVGEAGGAQGGGGGKTGASGSGSGAVSATGGSAGSTNETAGESGAAGGGGVETAGGSPGAGGTGAVSQSGGRGGHGPASGGRAGTKGNGGASTAGAGGADPCVGVTCESPPAVSCESANTRRSYDPIGSCTNGTCAYGTTDTPCAFGCDQGACKTDPCIGVSCATPPANRCQDAGDLVAYDTTGSCANGACQYGSHTVTCTCTSNACTTDPCSGVTCNMPPAPSCSGPMTRHTYAASGTCTNGSCGYGSTDTPCPFGCSGGACNADPCTGVTCNTPPSASCPDGTTLRTYSASGSCSGGTCTYSHADTQCAQQCTTSPSPACTCTAGYSGNGVAPNGCSDVNECTSGASDCDTSPVASCTNTTGSFTCVCPSPYVGNGHGANGCTCPTETRCDSSSETDGTYCSGTSTLITCTNANGCEVASSQVCTNVAAERCTGSHPSAECEVAAGFATDGGSSSALGSAFLFAVPLHLTQALTLTRIGFIAHTASTGVHLAVYADNNGLGTWKASALGGTVAAGRNEIAVDDPPASSPVTLAKGDYWIAVVTQASTQFEQGAVGPVRYTTWSPWSTPFPTGALAPTTPDSLAQLNLYIIGKP